jgi:hypothetical protein
MVGFGCPPRQDRPRIVDAERFKAEEEFWTNWDDANRKAEADD